MLNLLSILFGLVSLVVVIPATIPLLGWANWFVILVFTTGTITVLCLFILIYKIVKVRSESTRS